MACLRSILFTIVALGASAVEPSSKTVTHSLLRTASAGNEEPTRETMDEYKERKANEKQKAAATAAKDAKGAAVNKVIDLLESLQNKVVAEGEAEADAYNKFACFCKDTADAKNSAIMEGQDRTSTLTQEIGQLSTERDGHDIKLGDINTDIKNANDNQKIAQSQRDAAKSEYDTNAADLEGAIHALDGAIQELKASRPTAFVQVQGIVDAVRPAVLLADALGLWSAANPRSNAALFLQKSAQQPEVQVENYKFHSEKIIKMLEDLHESFTNQLNDVNKEEVRSVSDHDSVTQDYTDEINKLEKERAQTQKAKETATASIGAKSEELSDASANLKDDTVYLNELNSMCADKKTTYDGRFKVRSNELDALHKAITVVKDSVKAHTLASTVRLMQGGATLRRAKAIARDPAALEALEADAEADAETDAGPVGFLQRRSIAKQAPVSAQMAAKQAIADMLLKQGNKLHSQMLTSLAQQVTSAGNQKDVFAKVKGLIEQLINRLLEEQNSEAGKKADCDKMKAEGEQKRDQYAQAVAELNGEMGELEATIVDLLETKDTLDAEIKENRRVLKEQQKQRTAENLANKEAVSEANLGLEAVKSAIKIIKDFYAQAAKDAKAAFLQANGPADDAPDTGFEIGEKYAGAQGDSVGVLGMLDVIQSDFTRTKVETEKAEAEAAADFQAFQTQSDASHKEKTTAEEHTSGQLAEAKLAHSDATTALGSKTKELGNQIEALMAWKATCVDGGQTYSERVALREEEIASLNKALCILENYQEYGEGGAGVNPEISALASC